MPNLFFTQANAVLLPQLSTCNSITIVNKPYLAGEYAY